MDEGMIMVEEAQARILERVRETEIETVAAWRAVGRPLACDVASDIDLAPFASSAMDGYAVRSADLAGAAPEHPVVLDVVGHEAAGSVLAQEVCAGSAVRIMTGALVPEGADAVVPRGLISVDIIGVDDEGSLTGRAIPEASRPPRT